MKKRRSQARFEPEPGADKPDYAADLFLQDTRKKQVASKNLTDETGHLTVGDFLDARVADRLASLKRQMEEQQKQVAATGAKRGPSRPSTARPGKGSPSGSQTAGNDEEETSFAELFDPKDTDTATFAELLESSKLDWRKFK